MKELLNKKRLLLSLKVFAPYVIASFLTSKCLEADTGIVPLTKSSYTKADFYSKTTYDNLGSYVKEEKATPYSENNTLKYIIENIDNNLRITDVKTYKLKKDITQEDINNILNNKIDIKDLLGYPFDETKTSTNMYEDENEYREIIIYKKDDDYTLLEPTEYIINETNERFIIMMIIEGSIITFAYTMPMLRNIRNKKNLTRK